MKGLSKGPGIEILPIKEGPIKGFHLSSFHLLSSPQQRPSNYVPRTVVVKRTKVKSLPKINVLTQLCFCNIIILSATFLSYFSVIHSTIPHLARTRYKRCFSLDSGSATAQCHPHNLRFCVREPRDSQGVWHTG